MTLTKLTNFDGGYEYVNMEQVVSVYSKDGSFYLLMSDGTTHHIAGNDTTITALVAAA